MLKHMIEAKVLKLIFRRMDLLVRVLEVRFDHKR